MTSTKYGCLTKPKLGVYTPLLPILGVQMDT